MLVSVHMRKHTKVIFSPSYWEEAQAGATAPAACSGASAGVQPPPSARYSATPAAWRSCCSDTRLISALSSVRRASSSSGRLARPFLYSASVPVKAAR